MSNNSNLIYIDLETVIDTSPGAKERILSELKPPGNISKPETIAKWWQDKAPGIAEEQLLKTGLNPMYGSIISISWAFNAKPVEGIIRKLNESEKELIEAFYDVLLDTNTDYLKWIAYPIRFDLPFLLKRSIINNVRPPIGIPDERSKNAFCPMNWWHGWHIHDGNSSLDTLCKTLGIPGKGDMTGKDVWPAIQAGKYEKVLAYNKSDVEMLRQVHRRLKFLDWIPEDPKEEVAIANEEDAKLNDSGFFDKVLENA
ncbi:MAG: ribonuclease H-like domain-containing protein [Candidatus Cloacimonetes bacterium]|nr:ribonuclease H-like domain-containing protein [Candidatus Cloacimonadota bacterium]